MYIIGLIEPEMLTRHKINKFQEFRLQSRGLVLYPLIYTLRCYFLLYLHIYFLNIFKSVIT